MIEYSDVWLDTNIQTVAERVAGSVFAKSAGWRITRDSAESPTVTFEHVGFEPVPAPKGEKLSPSRRVQATGERFDIPWNRVLRADRAPAAVAETAVAK